jgi:hypothetical protein
MLGGLADLEVQAMELPGQCVPKSDFGNEGQ